LDWCLTAAHQLIFSVLLCNINHFLSQIADVNTVEFFANLFQRFALLLILDYLGFELSLADLKLFSQLQIFPLIKIDYIQHIGNLFIVEISRQYVKTL
jgi:hypothetical protein